MKNTLRIGFLGAGSIAKSHAYALDTLKYYYPDAPTIEKAVVATRTHESREAFAEVYGFSETSPPQEIWQREDLDALYILGPNQTHTPQLLKAAHMPNLKRIYVEKPIGTTQQDIFDLEALNTRNLNKFIMVGFQFLQKSAIRKALAHWQSGVFGNPVQFRIEYLHSSYLNAEYRKYRADRLLPIPLHGATADLGSHILSLLTAFLGDTLVVKAAAASGGYPDVPEDSDLCTTAMIEEPITGAIGTFVASRVSPGTGDHLILEIRGTRGTLLYNTSQPDIYESYLPGEGWRRHEVNSDYLPLTKYPSSYTPSGWLRALVHNHYLFLGGASDISFIPNLLHGIQVQKLIQQIAGFVLTA
ncbi:MAG: Gfo/Idh/MocA family oxidoreductase [Chloroflexota bacterium]|nr:Gfo/Idh/MocA family oxidoreductase [Chloroflexota bacterium]